MRYPSVPSSSEEALSSLSSEDDCDADEEEEPECEEEERPLLLLPLPLRLSEGDEEPLREVEAELPRSLLLEREGGPVPPRDAEGAAALLAAAAPFPRSRLPAAAAAAAAAAFARLAAAIFFAAAVAIVSPLLLARFLCHCLENVLLLTWMGRGNRGTR